MGKECKLVSVDVNTG